MVKILRLMVIALNAQIILFSCLIAQRINLAQPFLYFYMMQALLNTICPSSSWKARFTSLINEFPTPDNNALDTSGFGLVAGWDSWSIWQ